MRVLLDTHVFLWFISADARLPREVNDAVRDPTNGVFLSAVLLWEAIVKHGLGKLPPPHPPATFLPDQRRQHGIATLAVDEASTARLAALPPLHHDPFDRMLVCQALEHDLTLATTDSVVRTYPVKRLPP